MPNYSLKIIHSFNLVNTFYDLFRHICMSPDSPDSHMKQERAVFPNSINVQVKETSGKEIYNQIRLNDTLTFNNPKGYFYDIIIISSGS